MEWEFSVSAWPCVRLLDVEALRGVPRHGADRLQLRCGAGRQGRSGGRSQVAQSGAPELAGIFTGRRCVSEGTGMCPELSLEGAGELRSRSGAAQPAVGAHEVPPGSRHEFPVPPRAGTRAVEGVDDDPHCRRLRHRRVGARREPDRRPGGAAVGLSRFSRGDRGRRPRRPLVRRVAARRRHAGHRTPRTSAHRAGRDAPARSRSGRAGGVRAGAGRTVRRSPSPRLRDPTACCT